MPDNEKLSVFEASPGYPPGNWLVRFKEAERYTMNPREHGYALKKIFDDIKAYYKAYYKSIALEIAHDEALRKVMNEIQILRIEVANLKQGEVSECPTRTK